MNNIINNKEFLMNLVSDEIKFDLISKKSDLVGNINAIIEDKCNNNMGFLPAIVTNVEDSNYSMIHDDVVEKFIPMDRILIKNTNSILINPLDDFEVNTRLVNATKLEFIDTLIVNFVDTLNNFRLEYEKIYNNNILMEIDLLSMTTLTSHNNDMELMLSHLNALLSQATLYAEKLYQELNNCRIYNRLKIKYVVSLLVDFNDYESFFKTLQFNMQKQNEELLDLSMYLFNAKLGLSKGFKRSVL